MRRLTAAHELESAGRHVYLWPEINQISNLAFIYTFAEILLFLCGLPSVFIHRC